MEEETEIKISKSYSLDPKVIAWVTLKAARLTVGGQSTSASTLVNDILTAAMEADQAEQDKQSTTTTQKKSRRMQAAPIAA